VRGDGKLVALTQFLKASGAGVVVWIGLQYTKATNTFAWVDGNAYQPAGSAWSTGATPMPSGDVCVIVLTDGTLDIQTCGVQNDYACACRP
jgi:hypothetical protein